MYIPKLPSYLFKVPVVIKGSQSINEDGEPIYNGLYRGKCMIKKDFKRVYQNNKVAHIQETTIVINEDIGFDAFGGIIEVNNKKYTILSCIPVSLTLDDNVLYTVLHCE